MSGYPTCSGKLKNGSPCMSVVVSLKSANELEQMFCAYHARKAAELVPEALPKDPEADESRVTERESEAASASSSASAPLTADHPAAAAIADLAGKELWLLTCGKCNKSGPDALLQDAVQTALMEMSEERRQQDLQLGDLQREIASWPMGLHIALQYAGQKDPQVLADLMAKFGQQLSLDELGGVDGLAEWLRRSRKK